MTKYLIEHRQKSIYNMVSIKGEPGILDRNPDM